MSGYHAANESALKPTHVSVLLLGSGTDELTLGWTQGGLGGFTQDTP